MIQHQTTRFWHAAIASGLVDARALGACWEKIPLDKRTPEAADRRLARKTVESGHLTLWQAQRLLEGIRPQSLRLDKYVLLDIIGHGGMGRVYLARDTRLGRLVAIKVLSRERMNNPRALARFRREAKVGAQLQHENLVRIYDEGEAFGNHYLVMEYIDGKTVGRLVAEHGPLPAAVAARITRQVSLGLEHAYQKGLIHRDVNPLNILIDKDGTAKLTDLGLAIDLGDQGDAVTRDGATVGTFDYISPEQARHSRSVDIRSDIYSLGCTLYHMLAGRVPFPQPSLPEKLYAHQALDAEPLRSLAPQTPEALEALVRRMMSKSPDARPQTPLEVAAALEPFQSAPAPLSRIETAPERIPVGPGASALRAMAAAGPAGSALGPTPEIAPGDASDPELRAIAPDPSLAPPPMSNAGGLALDLGPAPPLSDSLSAVRGPSNGSELRTRLWLGAGAVLALIAVVAIALRSTDGGSNGTRVPDDGTSKSGTENRKGSAEGAPIVVRFLDDSTEIPQDGLDDAIRRAVGNNAEVVLRNTTPLALKGLPKISSGRVVIRAGEGYRPVLAASLSGGKAPFESTSDAELKLIGLTIAVEQAGEHPAGPPSLIEAAGDLTLERCTFTTAGVERNHRVVNAQGRRTRVEGSVFIGFDAPVYVIAYPQSDVTLTGSLFVRSKPGDARAGWPVALSCRPGPATKAVRKLTIDRCTVLGYGLAALDGVTPKAPLAVEVRGTVVRADSLLKWTGGEFPQGLTWKGRNNRYAVTGASWVLQGPEGFAGVPKGPADLTTWMSATSIEPETKEEPVKFAVTTEGVPVESRAPAEFVLGAPGEAKVAGVDPAALGPPGS